MVIWQDLHANVTRNHRCKTMKRRLAAARSYLNAYTWRWSTVCLPVIALAA